MLLDWNEWPTYYCAWLSYLVVHVKVNLSHAVPPRQQRPVQSKQQGAKTIFIYKVLTSCDEVTSNYFNQENKTWKAWRLYVSYFYSFYNPHKINFPIIMNHPIDLQKSGCKYVANIPHSHLHILSQCNKNKQKTFSLSLDK